MPHNRKRAKMGKVIYVVASGATVRSFFKEHIKLLRSEGYDLLLVCTDDEHSRGVVDTTNVRFNPIKISTEISPWSDLVALTKLVVLLIREKPSVVHAHMSKAGLVAMISSFICRVPHRIYHNHGMALFSYTGFKHYLLKSSEVLTCALATKVVFCGNSTLEQAVENKISDIDKSIVLGYGTVSGIDLDRFKVTLDGRGKSELRDSIGLEENRITVGYVGRIVAHKGIDNIINSWRSLTKEQHKSLQLVIAGSSGGDALAARLDDLCSEYSNVIYLGRVNNISEIYQLLNILLLPSWHEGFPYSVLEAQAMGVPAIVSSVPGNLDAVVPGKTGLIVAAEDQVSLAGAITKLAEDKSARDAMSQAARKRIHEYYSQTIALQSLSEFYSGLFQQNVSR